MNSSKPLVTLMVVILLVVPLITSCGTQSAPINTPEGEGIPVDSSGDEVDQGGVPEDVGIIFPNCPEEPVVFKLQLKHTFDFSPGRDTEKMLVKGNTTPDAWCLVTLHGTVIKADDCLVGYKYKGFIQGSGGKKCNIEGESTALISIEGECAPGVPNALETVGVAEIYLTIIETGDPAADVSGAFTCPGFSDAYLGFYPPSFSVLSFGIEDIGSSDFDSDLDITGMFEFDKSWTLIPVGYPFEP